jgi:hypothetical protein
VGQLVSAEDESPITSGRVYLVFDYTKFAVDPASGQPPAIPREAVHGELERDNRHRQIAAPDLAGFFEIGSATWVHASARIDVPGRSLIQVPVESGHSSAESALKIRVPRTARVVAAVVDGAGRPRERVQVTIAPHGLPTLRLVGSSANRHEAVWRSSTDSVGACTIDDLPANVPLEVELTSGLQVDRHTDDALVLNPGEERRLVLVFGGSSTVRGRLIDHADTPIANEVVWIRRADKRPRESFAPDEKVFAEARTDAEGKFSFER